MNCLDPAPDTYRTFTHSLQFISIPTYLLVLISLIFIKSNVFTTYRIFLIWHLLENVSFELYAGWIVEPVLHAPYTLMRTSGILSKAGVGGLVQTLILCLGIQYNAVSISEMFWFRYKASIINYKERGYTYFLRFLVNATRFIAIFDVVFCTVTFDDGFRFQQKYKTDLLKLHPSDTFLTCDSVYIMVPFEDYVSAVFVISWILQSIVLFLFVFGISIFVKFNLPKSGSEATWKLQQHLMRSLIIQASIHAIMLGTPNMMFVYAFLFGYKNESIAYAAFFCLTTHGFASSLAMIIFTKPLRQYFLVLFKLKKPVASKTSIISVNKRASVF
ncbi:Protein CBR-SRH-22 [Caenorhabditis briggsae]|uniref:Protein CBR-SRH-22 n=1 Tax=Caenorhabditis briggsae TaxID=6238 RepID=A8X7K8_CAEBR|nr:Protein CBR-SRH-22 [Caenorhabditis briggsae]CAP28619.1 Protein CBR-SRH-22 [Caenorhabditis briggsae]